MRTSPQAMTSVFSDILAVAGIVGIGFAVYLKESLVFAAPIGVLLAVLTIRASAGLLTHEMGKNSIVGFFLVGWVTYGLLRNFA